MVAEYERYMRSVKKGVIKAMGYKPEFTGVIISKDIADEMQKNVCHRDVDTPGKIGEDTTWELVPLKVDGELPDNTVLYIW